MLVIQNHEKEIRALVGGEVMMLKFIAFLLMLGTIDSIELDRIGFGQAIIQLLLAGAIFVIAEQAERIRILKRRLGWKK